MRGPGCCGGGTAGRGDVWFRGVGLGDVRAWGRQRLGTLGSGEIAALVMGASGLGTRGSEMSEDIGFGDIQE